MLIRNKPFFLILVTILITLQVTVAQNAADNTENQIRIAELKKKVDILENEIAYLKRGMDNQVSEINSKLRDNAPLGLVLFLFGGFCALWAQNTRRNPWSWFFIGLFFSVLAVITVLVRNAEDNRR